MSDSNEVYLHIDNGGVLFSVKDARGPTLCIQVTHFGHKTGEMELYVTKENLKTLRDMFSSAIEREYSTQVYCCATKTANENNVGCEGCCGCN